MSINRNIRNALATFGSKQSFRSNAPSQHSSRKKEYYGKESLEYIDRFAKYSSDFVGAKMQIFGDDGSFEWKPVNIRIADMVRPSASATKSFDDFKNILIADKSVDYVRQGTKFVTMGSTWLAVNPINISNSATTSVIRRCNAEWRYLDFFGNVKSEPIIIENALANANDSDTQEFTPVTKGYFNATMQYNEATKELDTNSVIILGRGAYRITGYADFIQEFTGDYDSVRLLKFSLRYEEPNLETDDLERHVAKGKLFKWNVYISGKPVLNIGEEHTFLAISERNGEILDESKVDLDYIWESSDGNIVSIGHKGTACANSAGTCSIIARLAQNFDIVGCFDVTVENTTDSEHVEFTSSVPSSLYMFEEVTIKASKFIGGETLDDEIEWVLTGASKDSYSAEEQGDTVKIKCWHGSTIPLKITAKCGNLTTAAEISLIGL